MYTKTHFEGSQQSGIRGELILKEYFNIFKSLLAQNTWGCDTSKNPLCHDTIGGRGGRGLGGLVHLERLARNENCI